MVSLPSDFPVLRSSLPSGSSRLPLPLAYQELCERQGETVRCATALCNARSTRLFCRFLAPSLLALRPPAIALRLAIRPPCLSSNLSAGLRLAKITEACAKWCPRPQISLYCVQACYAALCNARLLAPLRRGLTQPLPEGARRRVQG